MSVEMATLPDDQAPDIRKAYRDYLDVLTLQRANLYSIILLLVVPSGILLDVFVYPRHAWVFLSIRLACMTVLGMLLVLQKSSLGIRYPQVFGLAWTVPMAAYVGVMIFLADGFLSPYFVGVAYVMICGCVILPWSMRECVVACTITLSIHAASCLAHGFVHGIPPRDNWLGMLVLNSFLMVLAAIVSLASSFVSSQLRSREFMLRHQLDHSKQQLEESYKKLAELDKLKSQFFANISHELRTPLTLILAPLEKLRSTLATDAPHDLRETLDIMQDNSLRLLSLINDLLDLVRLEEGRLELTLQTLEVKRVLTGLVSAVRPTAESQDITLETDLKDADGAYVRADLDKLEKIYLNLIFNAIKFTPSGGRIFVRARVEAGQVIVAVEDTGVGIDRDKLPYVFDRFWQEEGGATRSRPGAGIGLALVRELVELHDGKIGVQSGKEEGSIFTVRLPVAEPAEGADVREDSQEDDWLTELYRKAQRYHVRPAGQNWADQAAEDDGVNKPSLLIIEDEPDMMQFLALELGHEYKLMFAENGRNGLQVALEERPDIILTDMMLPEMDGITICRKLREMTAMQTAKIVLITARAGDRTKLDALEAGADDFLTKPFSSLELCTRLRNLLANSQLERKLHQQNESLQETLRKLRETESQLIQAERLSALGNLSAGLMHEINNPINFMMRASHYLRESLPQASAETRETLGDIDEGLTRIHNIVNDLKTFAIATSDERREPCNPDDILRTVKKLLAHEIKQSVSLEEQVQSGVSVLGNHNLLIQLLVNLLQNAIQATADNPRQGKERLVRVSMDAQDGAYFIRVWDNGCGISEENQKKVFDPFFTTKGAGSGTGIGLSISHTIVKRHKGELSVSSKPGQFAEFVVRLPLC